MVKRTISHYKILEKLGEERMSQNTYSEVKTAYTISGWLELFQYSISMPAKDSYPNFCTESLR